jgi:hypothetical protein
MAMISARRTLVKGAVKIAYDAVDRLEDNGVKMNPKDRTKLVSNLLTVTVSEEQFRSQRGSPFERTSGARTTGSGLSSGLRTSGQEKVINYGERILLLRDP